MRTKLLLFDVDGTLTVPMKPIDPEFRELIQSLRKDYLIGVVGGSNIEKITYQLGDNVLNDYDYVFPENGLIAYKDGKLIGKTDIYDRVEKDQLDIFLQFVKEYIDKLDLPVKRSKHIEVRTGMINISPIGRDCTYEERVEYHEYDKVHNIRKNMISVLNEKFPNLNLIHVIGGMISFDTYPKGWDKTYCLNYLSDIHIISDIYFFGDKTEYGGNDYEIYNHSRVNGHSVKTYKDTQQLLIDNFIKN